MIEVGMRVAYSARFLQSIGGCLGEMPQARGVVESLIPLGSSTLAKIKWDAAGCPEKVNVKNLAKVGPNRDFCNVD